MTTSIADDVDRLNAIVSAVADFLSKGLNMRDPGFESENLNLVRQSKEASIRRMRAPILAQTLYEEARYLPNREQLDYLEDLKRSQGFALEADKLARSLLTACHVPKSAFRDENEEDTLLGRSSNGHANNAVTLSLYAKEWGYYNYRVLPEYGGMVIGGVGRLLRRSVRELAIEWLYACDKALCHVHDEELTVPPLGLTALVQSLAKDIAKRLTLHNKVVDIVPMEVDHLDPLYFEARADVEHARTRVDERCRKRNDLLALNAMAIVARDGGTTVESAEVLTNRMAFLRIVITTPPSELGLRGENARRMNLGMLARVIDPEMPVEARAAIATHWSQCHGAHAQTAIREAIARIESFDPEQATRFLRVASINPPSGPGRRYQLPVPEFSTSTPWFALPAPVGPYTRTGLDADGRRVVRLGSLVWQMMAEGCFEQGVVSRETLQPVAWEVLSLARVAREKIDHERTLANVGVRLHSFNESIHDRASELDDELNIAQCTLSAFSLDDILTAFNPEQPLLSKLITPLSMRTREKMANARTPAIPITYTNFARDALATLLPAVATRRFALNVFWTCCPHPLGDLLRTLPALKRWSPLEGSFKVGATELRKAHPKLREALEHHARNSAEFVRKTGGHNDHRPIGFTFESAKLISLLSR